MMSSAFPSSKEEQVAYVRRVLQLTGWSPTVLAKRAGLDPSTLSRFLANEREGHALRQSSMQRIGELIGGAELASATKSSSNAEHGFSENEASLTILVPGTDEEATVNALRLRHQNVDAWTLNNRSLELAGFRPGDILIVSLSTLPMVGDVVCAQVYDWSNSRAETMFRIYQPPFLIAATTDLNLMKPRFADDGSTTIKGVVLHSLRARQNRNAIDFT